MSGAPILLFGMPRSGTTRIAKILDSDPGTLYRHEPDSYGRMNFLPAVPDAGESDDRAAAIRAFYAGLPDVRDTKIAGTDPFFPKRYLGPIASGWNMAAVVGTKAVARVLGERPVPLWLPARARREARLVMKSIESVPRMGLVARAMPEARIVHILRHPYGFLASMLRGKYGQRFTDSDSIGEDLGLLEPLCRSDAGRRHGVELEALRDATPAERLAWQWVLSNDKAIADTAGLDNVTTVRYEDLCEDPAGEAERLFAWCGLSLGAQTRRFLERSTTTHQSRYYAVYKDPRRTANAWREELDTDTRRRLEPILRGSAAAKRYEDSL
jgi:hypothetical protein